MPKQHINTSRDYPRSFDAESRASLPISQTVNEYIDHMSSVDIYDQLPAKEILYRSTLKESQAKLILRGSHRSSAWTFASRIR